MNQLLKTLLIIVAGIVGVIVFASVALFLFFDPNDYRDEISAGVKEVTGRDLTIEGDLSLSIFPWLAIEVGRTELGNAEGFGDEPFMRFEAASLSVRMLPLILSQETTVGTASIEGLVVNLQVAADGTTNWDDLSQPEETVGFEIPETDTEPAKVDFGRIQVSDANISCGTEHRAKRSCEIHNQRTPRLLCLLTEEVWHRLHVDGTRRAALGNSA